MCINIGKMFKIFLLSGMIRSIVYIKNSKIGEVNEIWIINYIIQEIEKLRIEYEYMRKKMNKPMEFLANIARMGCRVISIVPGNVVYSQKSIKGEKEIEVYGMACYHHTQTYPGIEAACQNVPGELKKLLDLIMKNHEFRTHYISSLSLEVEVPRLDYIEAVAYYYKSK